MQIALYIVATPLGNLKDISERALEILRTVDFIAAEDTRHSRKLLTAYGIERPLISLHAHNESGSSERLIKHLSNGKRVALISDAGTPLISDPGYELVRRAHESQIPVFTIPGPSAVTAALSISGIPCERFVFEGFLPAKQGKARARLDQLVTEARTMVFFESPKRVLDTLNLMTDIFGGDRELAATKELTKIHERVIRGTIDSVRENLAREPVLGEFVLVLRGTATATEGDHDILIEKALTVLKDRLPPSEVAEIIAKIFKVPKKKIYQRLIGKSSTANHSCKEACF